MIAGLEEISDGDLIIGGERVNDLAPRDRDIAMVFQNYALYPHMTVRDNMGFALKLAKVDQKEINTKVEEAARILDLEAHLDRKPANLSGGQRQRVAMGRAIVRDPRAFLMDEPLSNLDAKLRVQMRTEVARIQQRVGTTTVYVTHDQTEAMTLGDRVAVMRAGVIQQVGVAEDAVRGPGEPVRRGLHRLSGDELPAGHRRRRLDQAPFGEAPAAEGAAGKVGLGKEVIAGMRPGALRGRGRGRGARHPRDEASPPTSRSWSRWAPSSTRTSTSRARRTADHLGRPRRRRGLSELPGQSGGDATAVVARSTPTSKGGGGQVDRARASTRIGSSCSTRRRPQLTLTESQKADAPAA
jgi:multiple sugar transport system ATP-binding protein